MSLISTQRLHGLRVIVTGGGTGGHTYPALTTIRALRVRMADAGAHPEVLWVGVAQGLEASIAAQNHIPFRAITTGKLRRHKGLDQLLANLADAFRIPVGLAQAIVVVARTRPDVVLSTGGYVSVPIGVAAWLFRRPYVMHEQIRTLGLANRILSRFATRILLSHQSSLDHLPARAKSKAVVTGNPIRPEVLAGDPAAGLGTHHLEAGLPLLLVTGGAQGAMQVNHLIAEVLPDVLPHCQVLHQGGAHGYEAMREVAAQLPAGLRERYHPVDYLHDELPDVLAAADIVVARAGAGTVAELTALGKACILIPLIPTGHDEQRRTARHLADADAARMLAAADATAANLRAEILTLLKDPDHRHELGVAARRHGRADAAERVVTEVLAAAGSAQPGRSTR